MLGFPGGPVVATPTWNPGYSYQHDPTYVSWGDSWIELCDATPCYIEADLAAWLASSGDWCPSSFTALEIWDCTTGSCLSVWPGETPG